MAFSLSRRLVAGEFDVQTLCIGDMRVHRVADMDRVQWPAASLLSWLGNEALASASQRLPQGMVDLPSQSLILSFNSFVVEAPHGVVLIDTGIGNGKERLDRPQWHRRESRFLEALTELGIPPERVDVVVNTHLHADHVGWNTVTGERDWAPTFAAARYVTPKDELAYWSTRYEREGAGVLHGAFADSVAPLLAVRKLEGVELPHEIVPGLIMEPAPGHTLGMAVVRLRAPPFQVLFLADAVHHPAQLLDPHKGSNFCVDPELAAATRRRLLEHSLANGTIVAPYHFPAPVFGCILRAQSGYDFVPL